jgi:hypothetical protein
MATKPILLGVSDSIASGVGNLSSLPVQFLLNDENQSFRRSIEIPIGYTAISAITLRYVKRTTGNLYLRFVAGHTPKATDSALTEDSTAFTVYAVAGTTGKIENITVPTTTFNALSSMVYGDTFSIGVQRSAADSLDTYEDDLEIVGFLVEFTTATVSGGAVAAASNVIVSLDDVKEYAQISLTDSTYDDFLQKWINYESNWIEARIRNKVKSQLITGELSYDTGRYRIRTKYFPIISLTLLQYLSSDLVWTDMLTSLSDAVLVNPENEFSNENNSFYIELSSTYSYPSNIFSNVYYPTAVLNQKKSYNAGYATIPTDLTTVCLERVLEHLLQFKKGSRFGQESISFAEGGGNISTRYKDLTKRHAEMMKLYVRRYE